MKSAPAEMQVRLIDILAKRRAFDTIPNLLKFANGSNAAVRAASMTALGQLGRPGDVAGMTRAILKATKGAERASAEKAVMFVCSRIEDKQQRAQPVLDAMQTLSAADRISLLPTLGRIGGAAAVAEIETAISSRNAAIHAAGLRALANWPDATVADQLIKIAKQDRHADHKRIARMALFANRSASDGRSDAQKLELLKTGMQLANNDAERNYALRRAAAIRLPETLRYVLPYLKQSAFAQQACQTIVELAHHRQLRDDNKAEFSRSTRSSNRDGQRSDRHRPRRTLQGRQNLGATQEIAPTVFTPTHPTRAGGLPHARRLRRTIGDGFAAFLLVKSH